MTTDATVNVRVLDSAYVPFPTFVEWKSKSIGVDTKRWIRYTSLLKDLSGRISAEVLERARNIAKRAAALDTGAIEGLYESDRGFTYTVAFETSTWETALSQKGEQVRPLFEAQLRAYDYVLDLATKAEQISEASIRALHEVVCAAQPTYRVMTEIGPQEQALPKGQYKSLPNHVRTRKGTDHSYAPVDTTPAEMARLVRELRSDAFQGTHPVMQAAYAHYAFVVIHPFADGNGRVARALASAFTYRTIGMPIVILSEQKTAYLDSLEEADRGNYQPFIDFMLAKSLDTIELVTENVRSALIPSIEESRAEIERLYVTKGGYTQQEVDAAGTRLLNLVMNQVREKLPNSPPNVNTGTALSNFGYTPSAVAGYRAQVNNPQVLIFNLSSAPPAAAALNRAYQLWLPRNAASDDDILLVRTKENSPGSIDPDAESEGFAARLDELIPTTSGVLQIRVNMFAERVVAEMFAELRKRAATAHRVG